MSLYWHYYYQVWETATAKESWTNWLTPLFIDVADCAEAEFLDEIQTKVLRVFLRAIHSHLYSFALRFLFLQIHATSYVFSSDSRNRRKPERKPPPSLCFKKSNQVWELLRLCPETSTKLYVHEFGLVFLWSIYLNYSFMYEYTHTFTCFTSVMPVGSVFGTVAFTWYWYLIVFMTGEGSHCIFH